MAEEKAVIKVRGTLKIIVKEPNKVKVIKVKE